MHIWSANEFEDKHRNGFSLNMRPMEIETEKQNVMVVSIWVVQPDNAAVRLRKLVGYAAMMASLRYECYRSTYNT